MVVVPALCDPATVYDTSDRSAAKPDNGQRTTNNWHFKPHNANQRNYVPDPKNHPGMQDQ